MKDTEDSYKTLGMWIPFASARNSFYATQAVGHLVGVKYDYTYDNFYGAAYYGGYFSQFGQRAVGSVSGMIDPAYWRSLGPLPLPGMTSTGRVVLAMGFLVMLAWAALRSS